MAIWITVICWGSAITHEGFKTYDKNAALLSFCIFILLSRPLLTSLSLHLCLVDSHSHRSVPKPRSRVRGHESNHTGREPRRRQHCQRPVWKPDMRVLWVRLSSCNLHEPDVCFTQTVHGETIFILRWNQSTYIEREGKSNRNIYTRIESFIFCICIVKHPQYLDSVFP